jgi:hypothetical protein
MIFNSFLSIFLNYLLHIFLYCVIQLFYVRNSNFMVLGFWTSEVCLIFRIIFINKLVWFMTVLEAILAYWNTLNPFLGPEPVLNKTMKVKVLAHIKITLLYNTKCIILLYTVSSYLVAISQVIINPCDLNIQCQVKSYSLQFLGSKFHLIL